MLETALRGGQHPLADHARTLPMERYCACFYDDMETRFGAVDTLGLLDAPQRLTGPRLVEVSTGAADIRVRCAESARSAAPASAVKWLMEESPASSGDAFSRVFSQPFVSGKGIGAIVMGAAVDVVEQTLGPTNMVNHGKRYDRYRYGPDFVELVVDVAPPGREGVVRSVAVSRHYRGRTDRGVQIGATIDAVKAAHGAPIFEGPRILLYADGTKFLFGDKGDLVEIGVVSAEIDNLMKMYGPK